MVLSKESASVLFHLLIVNELKKEYAQKIITSQYFINARSQAHHPNTTVASHTLGVAAVSLRLFYALEKLRINIDKEALTKAALCHDLGIVGRYDKFKNDFICCQRHPVDSVSVAKSIFPDLDKKTIDCIKNHMFPLTPIPPCCIEGILINFADKYCTFIETFLGKNTYPGKSYIDEV